MGVLSDSGKPLYWASGNLVVRRYARAYIAHDPTFVPEHRIFGEEALEWDCFSWGDATGRVQYYSPEWEALNVTSLPDEISGDARYDVARAQLGGKWRLPTEAEWQRLYDNCTVEFDTDLPECRVWLTSETTGQRLCFYYVGYVGAYRGQITHVIEGYLKYLSGNRRRCADFWHFQSMVNGVWRNEIILGFDWHPEGMYPIRPVTE